ncbi:MAG: hypothetical protein ACYC56_11120 [Candidatus Aquicultor sp.]
MGSEERNETKGEEFPGQMPQDEAQRALIESFKREDERWGMASQERDWIILIVIGILWASWMILTFLLEPGIR